MQEIIVGGDGGLGFRVPMEVTSFHEEIPYTVNPTEPNGRFPS